MARHDLNFLEFLQGFRRGELLQMLDQHQTDVVSAMAEIDGKGSITLKIAYDRNKAGQIEVTAKVSSTKPQRSLGKGIYFPSDDGGLTRRDPNQMDIEDEIERRRNGD